MTRVQTRHKGSANGGYKVYKEKQDASLLSFSLRLAFFLVPYTWLASPGEEVMMTPVTQWIYTQHASFQPHVAHLRRLAEPLETPSVATVRAALEDSCTFVQQQLLPYLHVVERVLYPLLEYMLERPQTTASLRYAHGELRQGSAQFLALRPVLSRESIYLGPALHSLVATLDTRVTAYFTEEAPYLVYLDRKVTPAAAHGLAIALDMVCTLVKVEEEGGTPQLPP